MEDSPLLQAAKRRVLADESPLGRYEELPAAKLARYLAIRVAKVTGGRVLDGSFSNAISACIVRLPFESSPPTSLRAVNDLNLLGVPRVLSISKHIPSAVYLWKVTNRERRTIHVLYLPVAKTFLFAAERKGDLLPKRKKPKS